MSETVLVVAAHPDDETLGVGATLARHAAAGDRVAVQFVTEGASAQYDDPDAVTERARAGRDAADVLGVETVRFADLPDMRLDTVPHVDVNAVVEDAVADVEPDVVYTHHAGDVNADHRAVAASTRVATRPGSGVERVYAYEVPSASEWGADAFDPDTYVDVSGFVETKLGAFAAYTREVREYPHPRSPRALRARAETRGSEAGMRAAEALALVRAYRR